MSTQIPTFLNPHIFYPDSCGRGLKPLWRAVSKQCGFGVWIHWFRVDGGPKRVKKYAVSKIYRRSRRSLDEGCAFRALLSGSWRARMSRPSFYSYAQSRKDATTTFFRREVYIRITCHKALHQP